MQLGKLIDAVYDAVFDPEGWDKVGAKSAALVNGVSCFVQVANLKEPSVEVLTGHGLESLGLDAYAAYYHTVDIWKHALINGTRGRVHLYHELVEQNRYENSEVFNDWVKPGTSYEVYWGLGATLPLWDKNHVGVFALHRSKDSGAMGEEERAVGEQLVPHIQRAVTMRRLVRANEAHVSGIEALCDMSDAAAMLVDEAGQVAYANRHALRLLGKGDGLRLDKGGMLTALQPEDHRRLNRRLAAVLAPDTDTRETIGASLRIARRDPMRPLVVTVGPVPVERFALGARLALVFIEDVWEATAASAEKIMAAFLATPAEARLVAALAEGLTLREAAQRFGISYNTARTELHSLLGRTGIGRQSELMFRVAKLR